MQHDDWPTTMLWLLLVLSEQKGAWDGLVGGCPRRRTLARRIL